MQGALKKKNLPFQKERMDDLLKQADQLATMIDVMRRMYSLIQQMTDATHRIVVQTKDLQAITTELRDHIADFDDFWRPIRNYLYWEPHCFDIPICWSLRSVFDTLDGIDLLSDDLEALTADLHRLDALMPQLRALMPPMMNTMRTMRSMMLTMYQTQN